MRRFYATTLLIALQLLQLPQAYGNTESKDLSPAPVSVTADPPLSDGSLPREPGNAASTDMRIEPQGPVVDNTSAPLSRDEICQMIERAANEEALPPEFFARLIWQESRFRPDAVGPMHASSPLLGVRATDPSDNGHEAVTLPRAAVVGQSTRRERRRRTAFVCSWLTRDSVTPRTSPISRRVRFS